MLDALSASESYGDMPMMHIDHAILHAFDFEGGSDYPSERELNLDSRSVKSYVQRSLRKLIASPESRHGELSDQSSFGAALKAYVQGDSASFIELSQQLARFMWEELRRCDDLEQCDLLVADFTDTSDMGRRADGASKEQGATTVATAALSRDAEDLSERFLAAALLPRRQAFVHELGLDDAGVASNDILRQDSTLPSPTQRIDSYLLVNLKTGSVDFHDKERRQAGSVLQLISDRLLGCSAQASTREVVQAIGRIVEEVADGHGMSSAQAVAQAKRVVTSSAERDAPLLPSEVGRQVFTERPELAERYEQTVRDEQLPEEVPMHRSAANRLAKSHRIRTDTGIEISFPSEYAADDTYIEFMADAQGRVSILIKNVGSIENR